MAELGSSDDDGVRMAALTSSGDDSEVASTCAVASTPRELASAIASSAVSAASHSVAHWTHADLATSSSLSDGTVTTRKNGPQTKRRLHQAQLKTAPVTASRQAGRSRSRRFAPGSIEYEKHELYRRTNGFIDESGSWLLHPALGKQPTGPMPPMPHMPPRQWDLLHIIYLFLERNGHDPAKVDQIWALDQSLVRRDRRGEALTSDALRGKPPSTPGLRWRRASSCLPCWSPCVLPRSRLFHNSSRAFISAGGMMQLNGIVLSACPSWKDFPAAVLASGAGNAFSMTVAIAHLVVASIRLCQAQSAGLRWETSTPVQTPTLPEFSLEALVGFYVQRMEQHMGGFDPAAPVGSGLAASAVLPAGLATSAAARVCVIRFGSLCSGTDFVAAIMPCIAREITIRMGAHMLLQLESKQMFSAEMDEHMRTFSACNFTPAANIYRDVTSLPRSIPGVDLLIFGSSCRGLSWMNPKRRCLGHRDPKNPLHTSGSTMAGCLEYVRQRRPRVLLLENVRGLLSVSKVLSKPGHEVRNIDHIMTVLKSYGYTCGHTSIDARKYLLPQSRPRIWIWAEHGGGSVASEAWPKLLDSMQFDNFFPVESLLVH